MLIANSDKVLFGLMLTTTAACGYVGGQIPDIRIVKLIMMAGSAFIANGAADSVKKFCLKAHAAFFALHTFEGAGQNPEGVPPF